MKKHLHTTILIILCLFSNHLFAQPIESTITTEHQADLNTIKQSGILHVLTPDLGGDHYLPRKGFPENYERNMLEQFANEQDLQIRWLYITDRKQLIEKLLAGTGDLIAANLTVTPERKTRINFTVPLKTIKEQVIVSTNQKNIHHLKDLNGKTVAVRKSSSYWSTLQSLKEKYPDIKIIPLSERMDTEQIIHVIANGALDATIIDSNIVEAISSYQNNFKVAFNFQNDRPIAWGIRKDAKQLKAALDNFLNRIKLTEYKNEKFIKDWDAIKSRKYLRILTRNSAASYFLYRGELMGFEYQLIKKFADKQGLRIKIIVPPADADLIDWLLEGKGDVITASMTISKQREDRGIIFTRPYKKVFETVVGRSDENIMENVKALSNRTLHIHKNSSYWQTLNKIKNELKIPLTIKATATNMETEDIIDNVANGQYDIAMADSHIIAIETNWRDDIKPLMQIGGEVNLGWAVRKDNKKLLNQLNKFLKKEYKGLFFNTLYAKYFKSASLIKKHIPFRPEKTGQLSPYDETVKKYAHHYGFDWKLIISQMFQESQFNPKAKSWSDAKGLMQLLKRTAKQMGFDHYLQPDPNIHAGIKYLSWLRERFSSELPVQDRIYFSLASYNVGLGHVRDARILAHKKGWDKNRWFNHVEKAMLLLSRKKYYQKARFGYCRGKEPVNYVRKINQRYQAYLLLDNKTVKSEKIIPN